MKKGKPDQGWQKADRQKDRRNNLKGWAFSVWPFVGFCIFALVPFKFSIVLSFSELHSFDITQFKFVGLSNYKYLLTSSTFWWSLLQTFYYWLSVPLGIVIGLLLAVMLNANIKRKKIIRVILFIPSVCSVVCVSFMWKYIFHGGFGVLNGLLMQAGIIEENIGWLTTGSLFMPVIIFTTLWGAGAGSLIFQAALEQVNQSCVEAAEIDGANKRKIFFHVTLPAISPTIFYVVIMNTIGAFQAMVNIQLLSDRYVPPLIAGKYDASLVSIFQIYLMAFSADSLEYGLGMASAFAWLLTFVIGIVTIVFFKAGNRLVSYDN